MPEAFRNDSAMQRHRALTSIRAAAYKTLFGDSPVDFCPFHRLNADAESNIRIDVFVYELELARDPAPVFACVTNGLSDFEMNADDSSPTTIRHELIMYVRNAGIEHIQFLHRMASLPVAAGFSINELHTIRSPIDELAGPYPHVLFLKSLVPRHAEFEMTIQNSPTTLLWAIPLSNPELEFKVEKGANALLDLMDAKQLPLIFEPDKRLPLV
jgi:hypothetical protein